LIHYLEHKIKNRAKIQKKSWKYEYLSVYLHYNIRRDRKVNKSLAAIVDWKTHQILQIFRDKLLPGMAGRSFRAMHRTADYKHGEALKSCRTEFFHIHNAANKYKGLSSF
jgi:hypothetical protein